MTRELHRSELSMTIGRRAVLKVAFTLLAMLVRHPRQHTYTVELIVDA